MLYQTDAVTQTLDAKAATWADLLTDAAEGWALIRQMEQRSKAAKEIAQTVIAAQAPADFAAAVADLDAGVRNIQHGRIDWAAVEDGGWN